MRLICPILSLLSLISSFILPYKILSSQHNAAMPNDPISFRRLAPEIFDKNWDTLAFYHPDVADSIRSILGPSDPQLAQIPPINGIRDALIDRAENRMTAISEDGRTVEIIGPQIRKSVELEIGRILTGSSPHVLVLFSCGDFSCLDFCREHGGLGNRMVFILEMRVMLFLAALAMRDLTEFLSHPNVFLEQMSVHPVHSVQPASSPPGLGEIQRGLTARLSDQALSLLPPNDFTGTAGAGFFDPSDRDAYLNAVRQAFTLTAEQHRNFTPKYEHFLSGLDIPRPHPLRRIWGYAVAPERMVYSIHLEMLRALFAGFTANGMEARLWIEQRERWSTRLRMIRDTVLFEPDIFLFLNTVPDLVFRMLYGPDKPVRRPRIVWLVDEFAFSPIGTAEGLGQWDHVFAMDPEYVSRLRGRDLGSVHYLPVAASIQQKGTVRECYRHPISFVGSVVDLSVVLNNLSFNDRAWFEDLVSQAEAGQTLFEVLPDTFESIPLDLIRASERYAAEVRKPFLRGVAALRYLLSVEANTRKRVRAVQTLLPHGVAVYGPPDWPRLLPSAARDAYRGPLAYSELPDLFASSQINLNLHSLQCPNSLNPRDFDVLASGGFLLSDYVSEADSGMLVGRTHAVFFKDETDLLEKTSLFLEDENQRDLIADRGHQHVLENHLLPHRAAEMMKQCGHEADR